MVQQNREKSRVDLDHVADVTEVNLISHAGFAVQDLFWRASFCVDDVAVDTGKTDCFDSSISQCRENVCVDLSGEDHLCHVERGVVSNATTLNDGLLDSQLPGELA